MDSDYHLLGSKDLDKEEKKEKKEHSSAYYRFVNQFKNHLKKIENNFSGDELIPLTNHFNFINKSESEFEEQRENCQNCYKALKEQLSLIEKYIPNFDINIFNTFFQTFEEYYSFFTKSKEILKTFSKFNDDTQNLYYICQRKNFCIEALKDYVDKISEEYADKIEQYEILNNKFKELTESYEKLYNLYHQNKKTDLNDIENLNDEKLMISKLNQKIQDLNIENDRLNKKYLECSRQLERINLEIKFNYILKSEFENKINEYIYKLSHFENENIKIKQEIKEIKLENEKLIEQNEYFENKINSELNNLNFDENNDTGNNSGNNLEDIMNNSNLIEENKNEEEEGELKSGKDLQDLLMNCEEYESEEQKDIEKLDENKENINNNLDKEKQNSIAININNEEEKKPKILRKKISESVNEKAKYSKSKTPHFLPKDYNLKKTFNPFNKFTEKKSDNINSAYNLMFKGKQFQFATRIAKKENHDYFKQFFFLLFQSMKMNSDKIAPFLGYDPETLYAQCRKALQG